MFRGETIFYDRRKYLFTGLWLVVAGGVAGGLVGGAVGLGGRVCGNVGLVAAAVLSGILAVGLGLDAIGMRVPLLQADRETEKRWVDAGRARWATYTGAMLGVGVLTRLGYLAWYLVPLSAFLSQSFVAGSVIWMTYGVFRTLSSIMIGLIQTRVETPGLLGQTTLLITGRDRARTASDLAGALVSAGLILAALS